MSVRCQKRRRQTHRLDEKNKSVDLPAHPVESELPYAQESIIAKLAAKSFRKFSRECYFCKKRLKIHLPK